MSEFKENIDLFNSQSRKICKSPHKKRVRFNSLEYSDGTVGCGKSDVAPMEVHGHIFRRRIATGGTENLATISFSGENISLIPIFGKRVKGVERHHRQSTHLKCGTDSRCGTQDIDSHSGMTRLELPEVVERW